MVDKKPKTTAPNPNVAQNKSEKFDSKRSSVKGGAKPAKRPKK